jgi:hypothetical protein
MDIPVGLAGTLTILFLVSFGVFLFPWLLKRRGGTFMVIGLTALLAVLFYLFDASSGVQSGTSAALALIWALLPLGTGLLVKRLQGRRVDGP